MARKRRKDAQVDRAAEMYAMYADQDMTFQQIADHYGVSKQAVDAMLKRHGYPTHRRAKLSHLDCDAIYARFQAGETLASIARESGVLGHVLREYLVRRGYSLERPAYGYRWTPDKVAAIKADYEAGMSQTDIAAKYETQQSFVSALMRRWGIDRREFGMAVSMGKRKRAQGRAS